MAEKEARRVVKKKVTMRKGAPKKRPTRNEFGERLPTFIGAHHQAIAEILKGQRPYGDARAELAWDSQVRGFAHCLGLDNKLFDPERFFKACGGLPTHKEGAA